jgi:sugar/nucleoside kinase (ribokinase family)
MISGFDIELETLDSIRMTTRERGTPIHLDLHSLTLGVDQQNGRFRRPVEEWRRWAFMVETLQMNEEEIAGLTIDRMSEQQTAGHLLTLGTEGVIVTKGSRGSTIYFNEKKQIARKEIPPVGAGSVLDTTGCGDIFGAAFFARYLKTRDLAASVSFAGAVAASRLGTVGSEGLKDQIGTVIDRLMMRKEESEPSA